MQIFQRYKLLKKQSYRQVPVRVVSELLPWAELSSKLSSWFPCSDVLALDFETQGLDAHSDQKVVGVGLSDGKFAVYIPTLIKDVGEMDADSITLFGEWLGTKKLVGHNVGFDGTWYRKTFGKAANWIMCTQGMFKQLATEGWLGQSWSLKVAMTEILGWDAPNTDLLHGWLKEHKLKLGDMWQAPVVILGSYCALDSAATYQLYDYFSTFRSKFTALFDYHEEDFLGLVDQVGQQQLRGLRINRIKLMKHRTSLAMKLEELLHRFLENPLVADYIKEFNHNKYLELLSREPPQMLKDGKTVARRWEFWRERCTIARSTNFFKITSKQHLGWLFYEKMFKCHMDLERGRASINVDGNLVSVRLTKTGRAPCDKNVLPMLGPVGKLVNEYNIVAKELSYVDACLQLSPTSTLHPSFKCPGTVTGRLSGGLET